MNKLEDLLAASKLSEVLGKNKDGECKGKKYALWALAIVGIIAAVAAIAYAVYYFFAPDYVEDFEDDLDDDFDDDFFEEEDAPAKEASAQKESK